MTNFRKYNLILGWGVFLVSLIVYLLTMEPTASFWDCGDVIATAYKMEVGHPPGAPFFMILGRFFTLFAGGDVTKVAVTMNILSATASAFTPSGSLGRPVTCTSDALMPVVTPPWT